MSPNLRGRDISPSTIIDLANPSDSFCVFTTEEYSFVDVILDGGVDDDIGLNAFADDRSSSTRTILPKVFMMFELKLFDSS